MPEPPALTPMLSVDDVPAALAFYESLGFAPIATMPGPDGKVARAILQGEGCIFHVMPAHALPEEGAHGQAIEKGPRGLGVILYLRVEDLDAWNDRVRATRATIIQPPRDEPWGDRVMRFVDPFGFDWCLARPIPR